MTRTPSLKDRLSRILIDERLLSEEDIQKAIAFQKEKGGTLSENLVNLGLISKEELMIALSHGLGIPPISLSRYKLNPTVVKLIPKKVASHYRIIPISKIGDVLIVAMSDPLNIFAIDDIKALTGFSINPIITTDGDIREAIDDYYGEEASQEIEKLVAGMAETTGLKAAKKALSEEDAVATEDLLKIIEEAPIVKFTNLLLQKGVELKASDILIEPLEREVRIRYRVDGILQEGRHPPKVMHNAIISRLKVISDLNIAERRLPQEGRFKIKFRGREVDFRISVLPSSDGEKIALRVLDKSQAMLDVDTLGFDEDSLKKLKKNASRPHGMILVSGPTGCGKTTTLYSVLKYVDSPTKNIVTVEDPIEYLLEGINQVAARHDMGLTFAAALRSILRQDPDVIMVGEIRDMETVDIAIKAALTGHLVLSTLHTTTAAGSVIRLLNMGVEPFLITSSVRVVATQRLVRKICSHCKAKIKLSDEVYKRLGAKTADSKPVFYKGKGCSRCLNTGYRGRTGVIEVLVITPSIRQLILQGAQEHQIRDIALKEGMTNLRENGIRKAIDGVTTIDEVFRVTVGTQDAQVL